jgi:hypothetical protein
MDVAKANVYIVYLLYHLLNAAKLSTQGKISTEYLICLTSELFYRCLATNSENNECSKDGQIKKSLGGLPAAI